MAQPINQIVDVSNNACFTLDNHQSLNGDKSTSPCSKSLDDIQSVYKSLLDIYTELDSDIVAIKTLQRECTSAAFGFLPKYLKQFKEKEDQLNTLIVKIDEEYDENKFKRNEMCRQKSHWQMWEMEINQLFIELERTNKEMETEYSSEVKSDDIENNNDYLLDCIKKYQFYKNEKYEEILKVITKIYKNHGIYDRGTLTRLNEFKFEMESQDRELFKEIDKLTDECALNYKFSLESENEDINSTNLILQKDECEMTDNVYSRVLENEDINSANLILQKDKCEVINVCSQESENEGINSSNLNIQEEKGNVIIISSEEEDCETPANFIPLKKKRKLTKKSNY